jgi:hypothetical protein
MKYHFIFCKINFYSVLLICFTYNKFISPQSVCLCVLVSHCYQELRFFPNFAPKWSNGTDKEDAAVVFKVLYVISLVVYLRDDRTDFMSIENDSYNYTFEYFILRNLK